MWALVQEGVVLETTDVDPEGRYHPDLKWRSCAVQVQTGWLFENEVFVEKVAVLEERIATERLWRDGELTARQWLRDRHRDEQDLGRTTTLNNEQFVDLLDYLQKLRDWPQSELFPDTGLRPIPPSWIDLQLQ
ncbi:phage tail assembly chaperone [Pseudomonas hefeiensis]|uniref:Phage tail assembly chaperone n=1 Tax=Pseudomonas hefeiensis TaxID=2738125 RepID=A0ABY9G811_9PSED|nr:MULTISPECIES: phage tail assembly chaperone [unclassified Pseudomonas]WLH11671.1 phage tail assembly chaperone [Pseudomonas sp. FP205]WLH94737.1 phage tail assembly chaperone [Pseudomonas sp. FP53]WLI39018.1 phage tail assembly chaperone [Pseudomonas sp. FP821]